MSDEPRGLGFVISLKCSEIGDSAASGATFGDARQVYEALGGIRTAITLIDDHLEDVRDLIAVVDYASTEAMREVLDKIDSILERIVP